ncbi:MAG: SRPBCC family protein [Acidimicrobiales bacterium]
MRIRSDRRHAFAVPPEELWEAMARVDAYREWWPWLRQLDATALVGGDVWSAVVQPPLPYRLRFSVHLDRVDAPLLASAHVTGDIEGTARLVIEPTAEGSELHFTSELAPTNAVLRTVASLASPMVRFGHEWVLDTGLRQFRDRALP